CLRYSSDIVSTGLRTVAADGVTELHTLSHMPSLVKFEREPTLERKARYLQHFFLFRKRKLEEVGGVDESIGDSPGMDEYHMIWVLLEQRATVRVVPKFLYNYRDHSLQRNTLRMKRPVVLANLAVILSKHGLPRAERKELIDRYRIWFGKPLHTVVEQTQD